MLGQATSAEFYDEDNNPSLSNWSVVFAWIYDARYLSNIPWYHMIMQSLSLPRKWIRFSCIDPIWMDAYTDGALSIGSNVDGEQDSVEAVIKHLLQEYFTTKDANSGYPPQFSISGVLLRSPRVANFPDLGI